MAELDIEDVKRCMTALLPFVERWNLSLNPENLQLMVYAVLVEGLSRKPHHEIALAVNALIDSHEAGHAEMLDKMSQ